MFADLVYCIDEGMRIRLFKQEADRLEEFPGVLLEFPINDKQIVEMVVVQGIPPEEVDHNQRLVKQ